MKKSNDNTQQIFMYNLQDTDQLLHTSVLQPECSSDYILSFKQ
jgi:hypothetical protein